MSGDRRRQCSFLADVDAALAGIDDAAREALTLSYFEGLTIVEIAGRLELSTAQVSQQLARGLLQFGELFDRTHRVQVR